MKTIGFLLIILGILGILAGGAMFGDFGISALIGAFSALSSGIGFLRANKAKQQKEGS